MLHPIDYRLSKNKFWLSTWNSYSLKNYKNLILNDKILNILGFIFKNCFKASYSFASPWSNPRKYRKYFSNFIIGFDGRRAIKTGPNKVKKLPGFIIPEDYNIIRFHNFSILKIYFLIDKNLETYWAKKQKNWRSPLKYFNMRYNKNKNITNNPLKFNKNLVNTNIEKKNFKITGFFIYLLNLLNNNSIRQKFYFSLSNKIDFFKIDKKYIYFKFYYDNFKLLNKVRNNFFLFYILNKKKLGLLNNKNNFKILYLNLPKKTYNIKNNLNKSYIVNYKDYKKYNNIHNILFKKKNSRKKVDFINKVIFYKQFLKNKKFFSKFNLINNSNIIIQKKLKNNFNKYILFNKNLLITNFNKFINKKIIFSLFNSFRSDIIIKKKLFFDINIHRKRGLTLFLYNNYSSYFVKKKNKKKKRVLFLFKKYPIFRSIKKFNVNNDLYNYSLNKKDFVLRSFKNWNLNIINNRSKINIFNIIYNKQFNINYKYLLYLYKINKNKKYLSNLLINFDNIKKMAYFNKSFNKKNNLFKNKFKKSNYKLFCYQNYLYKNWSKLFFLLNLKKKNNNKKFYINKKSTKINNYFNKLLINCVLKNNFNLNKLVLQKNIYAYLKNNQINVIQSLKINKKRKNKFNKINILKFDFDNKRRNKHNLGNSTISITNFTKKRNYFFNSIEKEDSEYYNLLKSSLKIKKNEYKTFLKIGSLGTFGSNFNSINNFNYDTSAININYFFFLNKTKQLVLNNNYEIPHNNNNILIFKKLLESKKYKWNTLKTIKLKSILNTYFKKTFLKSFANQDIFTQDNINQINKRLEKLPKYDNAKLIKFKPYSFKSVSKFNRYKFSKLILTKYITKEIKYNTILNFLTSLEYKKFISKKNISYKAFKVWFDSLIKAKGTILFNNLYSTKFNKINFLNYSYFSFNKKLQELLFLNKNIKIQDKYIMLKESKKKTKKYLLNYKNLIIKKTSFSKYLKKLQFKYFKRKKKSFKNNKNKNIILLNYKPLLFDNLSYNSNKVSKAIYKNFNNDFYKNFFISYEKKQKLNPIYGYNNYNYKANIYKYYISNKYIKLKQLYLPIKIDKNISSIVSFVFKNSSITKKIAYKKSNNMLINKYIRTRLANIFLSAKSIHLINNHKKNNLEDFNYRIYGLAKKISSTTFLNKKKIKTFKKFQPKTFLYWDHLRWFNVFIKSKFNFKMNNFYNNYNNFKLYENFKGLNFFYYKNFKNYLNCDNLNSSQLLNNNYNKLNTLIFYSTVLKMKNSFLYYSNKKKFHKKKLFLNWTYDILFLSNSSKRLNYLPHFRFKPIRDSMYMWRINSRKLNLLTKYFKARTKFFKNKLNFISQSSKRNIILSYLKLMESNFLRIKKSMHRELPLIYTKKYLLIQLKKLNNYIKVLLKRQKKRLYYKLKQKKKMSLVISNTKRKNSNLYNINLLKENKYIFKKLYSFVNKRFFLGKKNLIDYIKKFIEHLFLVIFKFNHLRVFYIKKYQMNIMSTKAKLFKNLFNYRLATGFKVPFLVKVICKKLNFDKSLVGCKIGFFGRYSKKLRNRKLWKYVKHLKPSVISTPLDYHNILILQKWGITGIKLSLLRKKTFNFIFN